MRVRRPWRYQQRTGTDSCFHSPTQLVFVRRDGASGRLRRTMSLVGTPNSASAACCSSRRIFARPSTLRRRLPLSVTANVIVPSRSGCTSVQVASRLRAIVRSTAPADHEHGDSFSALRGDQAAGVQSLVIGMRSNHDGWLLRRVPEEYRAESFEPGLFCYHRGKARRLSTSDWRQNWALRPLSPLQSSCPVSLTPSSRKSATT